MTNDNNELTVFIVDDDDALRDLISMMLESLQINSESYPGPEPFLEKVTTQSRGCIVCDVRMPRMSGLELQKELQKRRIHLPMVFISGHSDIPIAVEAVKNGAVHFIQKPFREQELIDCVNAALDIEQQQFEQDALIRDLIKRVETLSDRELQVMKRVVSGQANKVVALDLGLSQRTVEIHRSRVMEKMGARSLAELVRMEIKLSTYTDKMKGQE